METDASDTLNRNGHPCKRVDAQFSPGGCADAEGDAQRRPRRRVSAHITVLLRQPGNKVRTCFDVFHVMHRDSDVLAGDITATQRIDGGTEGAEDLRRLGFSGLAQHHALAAAER